MDFLLGGGGSDSGLGGSDRGNYGHFPNNGYFIKYCSRFQVVNLYYQGKSNDIFYNEFQL